MAKTRTPWNEREIARAIAQQFFKKQTIVMVPNCNWTGHECDVLVVTTASLIVDVEIKISRADLKADAKKDKWWIHHPKRYDGKLGVVVGPPDTPRDWPRQVWKHYYALPKEIWTDDLLDAMPSKVSGVLLLEQTSRGNVCYEVRRRATPNKDPYRLKEQETLDIARLANLRMWDAYARLDLAQKALAESQRPAIKEALAAFAEVSA